jgi:ABC-type bacteriocin/lantibiotic exporter with double-glycine peptidase domain
MPLDVPLLRQEHPWTCLPACIRMVLAYRGQLIEEADVAAACRTTPLRGTLPERAVEGVQQLGYHALWFENADMARLQDLINHDWPVIVFLRARDLPGGGTGLHGVVVIDVAQKGVTVLDPQAGKRYMLGRGPFLSAWRALDAQGMVIWQ